MNIQRKIILSYWGALVVCAVAFKYLVGDWEALQSTTLVSIVIPLSLAIAFHFLGQWPNRLKGEEFPEETIGVIGALIGTPIILTFAYGLIWLTELHFYATLTIAAIPEAIVIKLALIMTKKDSNE